MGYVILLWHSLRVPYNYLVWSRVVPFGTTEWLILASRCDFVKIHTCGSLSVTNIQTDKPIPAHWGMEKLIGCKKPIIRPGRLVKSSASDKMIRLV